MLKQYEDYSVGIRTDGSWVILGNYSDIEELCAAYHSWCNLQEGANLPLPSALQKIDGGWDDISVLVEADEPVKKVIEELVA